MVDKGTRRTIDSGGKGTTAGVKLVLQAAGRQVVGSAAAEWVGVSWYGSREM